MQGPGHIKNPLTIIAIFAGLSEISGTVVLPLIAEDNQFYFMWFVMAFPMLLVAAFFFILLKNHRVLYAPSDFKNEDHFVDLLPKATISDQVKKLEEEASYIPIKPVESVNAEPSDNTETVQLEISTEAGIEPQSAIEQPNAAADRMIDIQSTRSMRKNWDMVRIASEIEDQVFDMLQAKYQHPISRGIASNSGVIDGVVRDGNNFVIFEVRTADTNTYGWEVHQILDTLLEKARSLKYPPSLELVLTLVLVFSTSNSKLKPSVNEAAKNFEKKSNVKTNIVAYAMPFLEI